MRVTRSCAVDTIIQFLRDRRDFYACLICEPEQVDAWLHQKAESTDSPSRYTDIIGFNTRLMDRGDSSDFNYLVSKLYQPKSNDFEIDTLLIHYDHLLTYVQFDDEVIIELFNAILNSQLHIQLSTIGVSRSFEAVSRSVAQALSRKDQWAPLNVVFHDQRNKIFYFKNQQISESMVESFSQEMQSDDVLLAEFTRFSKDCSINNELQARQLGQIQDFSPEEKARSLRVLSLPDGISKEDKASILSVFESARKLKHYVGVLAEKYKDHSPAQLLSEFCNDRMISHCKEIVSQFVAGGLPFVKRPWFKENFMVPRTFDEAVTQRYVFFWESGERSRRFYACVRASAELLRAEITKLKQIEITQLEETANHGSLSDLALSTAADLLFQQKTQDETWLPAVLNKLRRQLSQDKKNRLLANKKKRCSDYSSGDVIAGRPIRYRALTPEEAGAVIDAYLLRIIKRDLVKSCYRTAVGDLINAVQRVKNMRPSEFIPMLKDKDGCASAIESMMSHIRSEVESPDAAHDFFDSVMRGEELFLDEKSEIELKIKRHEARYIAQRQSEVLSCAVARFMFYQQDALHAKAHELDVLCNRFQESIASRLRQANFRVVPQRVLQSDISDLKVDDAFVTPQGANVTIEPDMQRYQRKHPSHYARGKALIQTYNHVSRLRRYLEAATLDTLPAKLKNFSDEFSRHYEQLRSSGGLDCRSVPKPAMSYFSANCLTRYFSSGVSLWHDSGRACSRICAQVRAVLS